MKSWYAVYTKSKNEDLVSERLRGAGIDTLNPKIKHKKFRGSKLIEVTEPLFPSYIFALFDPVYSHHMIKYTRGVRYIVGKDNPIIVPEEIITSVRHRMIEGIIHIPGEKLKKGQDVVVHEGPFKGFEGIFERYVKGTERVIILLHALHGSLEVDAHSVTSPHKQK